MESQKIDFSIYKDEFEATTSDKTYLLSKTKSSEIWDKFIDNEAKSYFQLNNQNWIIKSKNTVLGKWLEDFNKGDRESVKNVLDKKLYWENEDVVYYCISKYLIIESSWYEFKELWMSFLACEDDCPILINKMKPDLALIFNSLGDIIYIENR